MDRPWPASTDNHSRLVIGAVSQHRPSHTRSLVGQRDGSHVGVATRSEPRHPLTEEVVFVSSALDDVPPETRQF